MADTQTREVPLTPAQIREVDARAELAVRQYFDYYLKEVVPDQHRRSREHTAFLIRQHDDAEDSHGYAERRLNKAIWIVAGAAMAGSGGAVGVAKLLQGLGA